MAYKFGTQHKYQIKIKYKSPKIKNFAQLQKPPPIFQSKHYTQT